MRSSAFHTTGRGAGGAERTSGLLGAKRLRLLRRFAFVFDCGEGVELLEVQLDVRDVVAGENGPLQIWRIGGDGLGRDLNLIVTKRGSEISVPPAPSTSVAAIWTLACDLLAPRLEFVTRSRAVNEMRFAMRARIHVKVLKLRELF
jgi:hypothetical protein